MACAPVTVSRGSTEPKTVLLAVSDRLGLGLDPGLPKPALGAAIARRGGVAWDRACDSRHTSSGGGSTITLTGLERVREATQRLVERTRAQAPSLGVLPASTPLEEELRAILGVLCAGLPRWLDGRETVLRMRAAGWPWRQTEWPGFYLEHDARQRLSARLGGSVGPRFGRTEFDYRLIRVFDVKTHTHGSSAALWLNDAQAVEKAVLATGGIGFILFAGAASADTDGSFRAWHERLKGPSSTYSKERARRGAPARLRKQAFEVETVEIVYIHGISGLQEGLREGWLSVAQQGRQSGGGARRPKLKLLLERVPLRFRHASRQ